MHSDPHEQPTTALTPLADTSTALAARGLEARLAEAGAYVRSGLLPRHIKTAEQFLLITALGKELGLRPLASLRLIHVIENVPVVSGQLLLSLVRHHKGPDALRITESDAEHAVVEVREGAFSRRFTFTLEDAQRAGLAGKDNWRKYPEQMCTWRAVALAARACYPEVLSGLYAVEELDEAPVGDLPAHVWEDAPAPTAAPVAGERWAPDADALAGANAPVAMAPADAPTQTGFTSPAPPASGSQVRAIRAHLERTGLAMDWVLPEGKASLEDLTLPEASAVLGRLGRTPNAT
jgi:hypothetical protein